MFYLLVHILLGSLRTIAHHFIRVRSDEQLPVVVLLDMAKAHRKQEYDRFLETLLYLQSLVCSGLSYQDVVLTYL